MSEEEVRTIQSKNRFNDRTLFEDPGWLTVARIDDDEISLQFRVSQREGDRTTEEAYELTDWQARRLARLLREALDNE